METNKHVSLGSNALDAEEKNAFEQIILLFPITLPLSALYGHLNSIVGECLL